MIYAQVRAVRADQEVINFLINCGNKNLQYLLVPNRLQAALAAMDTDHDGHIDLCEWEACIEIALQNKLEQRAAAREAQAKAAQKEIAEFTGEFLSAARQCFQLIDKDCGGSLSKTEIVDAVKTDQEVIRFLTTCGEENLQFLLHPPRLQKALEILDTDNSGEVDEKEWDEAIQRGLSKRLEQLAMERERRERAALRADAEFSTEFLNAARKVFQMIDDDGSGTLEKAEIVTAVKCNQRVIKFLVNCGNPNLQYLLVPARLESALQQMDTDRDGHIDEGEWCVSEPETLGRLRRGRERVDAFRGSPVYNNAGRRPSRSRCRTSWPTARPSARCKPRRRRKKSRSSRSTSKTPRASASSSSTRTAAGPWTRAKL